MTETPSSAVDVAAAICLACAENGDPEVLASIALHASEEVRKALAANPALPAILAPDLALAFPEIVFENPSFEALAHVQPELLEAIGRKAFNIIRDSKPCPPSYLDYASGIADDALMIAIVGHPDISASLLHGLTLHESPAVRAKALLRLNETQGPNKETAQMSEESPRNTINRTTFDALRARFGWCASWAIWSPAGSTPKSGIADLALFDDEKLETTLGSLHADVIFVGLNISRDPGRQSFSNFHSENSAGQDYKLRHALEGTR